jgi:cytochrome c
MEAGGVKARGTFLAFGALLLAACASQAAEAPDVAAGRRIAERDCGGCHAIANGKSRLADAPAFADLHRRYGPNGLEGLLTGGMLTADPSLEEGNLPGHPRMPQRRLGPDERAYLTAYLRSLEPRPPSKDTP